MSILSLPTSPRLEILDFLTGCKYYAIKLWDPTLGEFREVFIDGWLKARIFQKKTPWPRCMWDSCVVCNQLQCECNK